MSIRLYFSPEELVYRGPELSSHFAYRMFDVLGDSCVSFIGGCWVETPDLVDLADQKKNERIFSKQMVHFMIEHFEQDLGKAVLRQRVFAAIVQQELQYRGVAHVVRRGDDLYVGESKLSVSIATLTPVSTMIHFGINVISQGTPVKTLGLADFQIEPRSFALAVMDAYRSECDSIDDARCKARAVP
jgi:hypothetical protein